MSSNASTFVNTTCLHVSNFSTPKAWYYFRMKQEEGDWYNAAFPAFGFEGNHNEGTPASKRNCVIELRQLKIQMLKFVMALKIYIIVLIIYVFLFRM